MKRSRDTNAAAEDTRPTKVHTSGAGAQPSSGAPGASRPRGSAHTHVLGSSASAPIAQGSGASAAQPQLVRKREDYLAWDDYFLSVAFVLIKNPT